MPPKGGKKTSKYGVPPAGPIKLNVNNIQIYTVGIENTNIKKLTKKAFKNKNRSYVDQFYTAQDLDYTSSNMTMSGIIDIVNGVKNGFKPTCKFNPKWDVSPMGKFLGEWYFRDPLPEIEGKYSYKKFRKQIIREVYKSGTNKRGDLHDYLSKLIVKQPRGLYCRMIDGSLECTTGIYIKCNRCACLSRLPILFNEGYVRQTEDGNVPIEGTFLTKEHVCDMIETVENRIFNDGKMEMEKAIKTQDFDDQIAWMLNLGSIHCYNCGWHISEAATILVNNYFVETIEYGDYGINAMTLEEFLKCLNLDNPPPEDLPKSLRQYNKSVDMEVLRIMGKMKVNFANMYYNISANQTNLISDEYACLKLMASQHMIDAYISDLELEEILLTHEMAQLSGGEIIAHPSTLNVYHSLYDIVDVIPDSTWFSSAAILMETVLNSPVSIELQSASNKNCDIIPGTYVLHINTNANTNWWVDGNNLYTATTGSDTPVIWNRSICENLSNCSIVTISDKIYSVKTIKSTPMLCISYVCDQPTDESQVRVMRGKTRIKVLLPTVDLNSILKTIGMYGTRWEWQFVDTEMVNRLLVFGLSGEKTSQSFLTYLAGLTTTRYSAGGRLIDLTGMQVNDGLPELTYVLLILSDNVRLQQWCKINYVSINAAKTSNVIYELILSRTLAVLKMVNNELYSKIESFVSGKTEMMYNRDNIEFKRKITTNLKDLQPYRYIDGKWDGNFVSGNAICGHLHNNCEHKGDYTCSCCGMSTKFSDLMCSCCKQTNANNGLSCGHADTGKEIRCQVKINYGLCSHTKICNCCKRMICTTFCPNCYDDESLANLSKVISTNTRQPMSVKVEKKLLQPKKEFIEDEKKKINKTGKSIRTVNIEEEKYVVPSVLNLTIDNFFYTSVGGDIYCLYNCLLGQRTISTRHLMRNEITDNNMTENMCMVHAIVKQTNITFEELISVVGYKREHNIADLRRCCEAFTLNAIVQIGNETSIMIRNGAIDDKYIMLAHTDAFAEKVETDHWYIVGSVHLISKPTGLWSNADYCYYNIPESLVQNVLYMERDEYLRYSKKLQNFITNSGISGVVMPDWPVVKVLNDKSVVLTNSTVDDLAKGRVNVVIPDNVQQLATAVFNVQAQTNQEMYETAFCTSDMQLDEMVRNKMVSTLVEIGKLKREIDNGTVVRKRTITTEINDRLIVVPGALKCYKALEVIIIEYEDGSEDVKLTAKLKGVVMFENNKVKKIIRISTIKQSLASFIRAMRALCKAYENASNYSTAVLKYNVKGIGGAGKTWSLVNKLHQKSSTTYICKFSNATNKQKENGWADVLTLEAAQLFGVKTHNIAIDEAGAVDIVDLLAILDKPRMNIWLTGDVKQIGVVDFTSTPGMRLEINVMDYMGTTSDDLTVTNRYGEPYASEVVAQCYDSISVSHNVNWETTYEVLRLRELDDAIKEIRKRKIDAIFCFFDDHMRYMSDEFGDSCKCLKVHADQGDEADRVAVLYWSNDEQIRGIMANSTYVTTAITRPRKHMLWITNVVEKFELTTLLDYTKTGAGTDILGVIDLENMRLNKPLSRYDQSVISKLIYSKINNIETLEIKVESLRIVFRYNNIKIDVTIDSDGIKGNDLQSRIAISGNRHKFRQILSGLGEFDSAIEEANDSYLQKRILELKCKTYKLTELIWSRLILLSDACLINQRANANLKLKTPLGIMTVKLFNGCSVLAGLRFSWYDKIEREVLISSGHVENGDTIGSLVASHVRTFAGDETDVISIRMMLSDPSTNVFPMIRKHFLITRIIERLTNIVKQKTLNTSGIDTDVGDWFKEKNQTIVDKMYDYTGVSQKVVTHQEVNQLLYYDGDVVRIWPMKRTVRDLGSVMVYLRPVDGIETHEVGLSVKSKMDNIIEKRVFAEFTEYNKILLPEAVWRRWSHVFNGIVNNRNIVPVASPSMDDTIASIANAWALNFIKTMLNTDDVDVIGVDAVTVVLGGCWGNRINDENLNLQSRLYIDTAVQKMIDHETITLNQYTGVDKIRIEKKLETLKSGTVFKRNGVESDVLLIGLGDTADNVDLSQYKSVLVLTTDMIEDCVVKRDGKSVLVGDNGRIINLLTNDDMKHYSVIATLGPVKLCSMTYEKPATIVWNNVERFGIRTFALTGTNMPVVKIPRVVFTKLLSRAMIEDVNIADMLAFCRSLASTVVYSSSGMYSRYKLNNDELIMYCVIVMNIAGRHRAHMDTMSRLFNTVNNRSGLDAMRDVFSSKLISVIYEYISQSGLMDYLGELIKAKDTMEESSYLSMLLTTMKDKDVIELSTSNTLLLHRYDSSSTSETDSFSTKSVGSSDDSSVEKDTDTSSEDEDEDDDNSLSSYKTISESSMGDKTAKDTAKSEDNYMEQRTGGVEESKEEASYATSASESSNTGAGDKGKDLTRMEIKENNWHNCIETLQTRYRYKRVKKGAIEHKCDNCPLLTFKMVEQINKGFKLLIKKFEKFIKMNENILSWTVVRGTAIAALRYGKMAIKVGRYANYVDSDLDVVVYVDESVNITGFINKLVKYMKPDNDWRRGKNEHGEMPISMMSYKCAHDDLEFTKCKNWHPVMPNDGKVNGIALDICVLSVKNNAVFVGDIKMQQQTGLSAGAHLWNVIKPRLGDGIKLYDVEIPFPKNIGICLNQSATDYNKGKLKELAFPYWPGMETCSYTSCEYSKPRDNALGVCTSLYKLIGTTIVNQLKNVEYTQTLKPMNIAIVFSGSRGDFEPLLSVLDNLSTKHIITIYKPSDYKLTTQHTTINYVESYKGLVYGNKTQSKGGDGGVLKHLTESLKAMHGTYDYVIGTHFSREIEMLRVNYRYIRLYPLIEKWNKTPFEDFARFVGLFKSHENKHNTLNVSCVPSEIRSTQYTNIGWPIRSNILDKTKTDDNLIMNCDAAKSAYTLITFGSMGMYKNISLLRSILSTTTGMVVWVKGYTDIDTNLEYGGNKYDTSIEIITKNLSIVKEVNYHAMCPYVKHVHCHGGAGTMFCFWYNKVPMTIHPQAYDQVSNAKWYMVNKRNKQINYKEEYDNFRLNIVKMGLLVNNKDFDANRVEIQYSNSVIIDQRQLLKQECEHEINDIVISRNDCVLHSARKTLATKLYDRFKLAYEQMTSFQTINTIEDIIVINLLSKTPITIVDVNSNTLYREDAIKSTLAIGVDLSKRHADVRKITTMTTPRRVVQQTIRPEHMLDDTMIRFLNGFVAVMGRQLIDHDYLTSENKSQLKAIRRQQLDRIVLVAMRTKRIITLCETVQVSRGFSKIDVSVAPWSVYLLLTEIGRLYGIAIRIPDNGLWLFTGYDGIVKVHAIHKVSNMRGMPVMQKIAPPVSSKITAINQSTLAKCKELGVPVVTVLAEEFVNLYVYNTWNRKHHHEKEREAILKAKLILKPTGIMNKMETKQLIMMRCPRPIMFSGIMRYAIEPVTSDNITINAIDNITNGDWLSNRSVWVRKGNEDVNAMKTIFKLVDNDQWERHEIKFKMQANILEQCKTVSDVLNLAKEELQETELDAIKGKFSAKTASVKIVNVKFPITQWERVCQSGLVIQFPFILIAWNLTVFEVEIKAAGVKDDGLHRWNDFETTYKHDGLDNKFNMVSVNEEDGQGVEIPLVDAMQPTLESDTWGVLEVAPELIKTNKIVQVINTAAGEITFDEKDIDLVRNVKVMDYWDNFNQLADNVIQLPQTPGFKVKSRVEPTSISVSSKLRNEQYPEYARPSMTNAFGEELASVTTRQGSVKNYVKRKLNVRDEFELFVKNYFIDEWKIRSKSYTRDPIQISRSATEKWVRRHNYPKAVLKNLKELFDSGFEIEGISEIRVHGKIEQTTRMNKFARWFDEVTTRSIMASAYCISALFSPVFLEIKKRFKDILNGKVVYSDGMSPDQLASHMSTIDGARWIVEDDLSKQDAATTHLIIGVEFEIYKMLGMSLLDLEMYSWIHKKWRFRGKGFSGVWDAMRLSGQPTTALGNAITNLIVHNRFFFKNKMRIIRMYVLGDDNVIMARVKLDVSQHGTITKEMYNIVSKVSQSEGVGQFLSMIVYVKDGKTCLAPDYRRMRHRYSVCNYVFTNDERLEKLRQRKLSYCLMLGNVKEAVEWIENEYPSVQRVDWYNVQEAVDACASYYNVNKEEIMLDVSTLMNMIKGNKYYISDMPHWQSSYKQTKTTIMLDKVRNNIQYMNVGYD